MLLVLAVLPCISHPVHLVANLQHVSHSCSGSLDNLSIFSANNIIAARYVINDCRDESFLPPDNWMLMLHFMSISRTERLATDCILTEVVRKL